LQTQKIYIEESNRDKMERDKIEINDLKKKLKLVKAENNELLKEHTKI